MTRPKYRAYVWKDTDYKANPWRMGVWEDSGPAMLHPDIPNGYPTHTEAVAAGLAWAAELNTQEQEEA